MTEVVVLLKLEVDLEQLKRGNDTDDDVKSKVRACIAEIIGNVADRQQHITLLASSLAVSRESAAIAPIRPWQSVFRLHDMKVE